MKLKFDQTEHLRKSSALGEAAAMKVAKLINDHRATKALLLLDFQTIGNNPTDEEKEEWNIKKTAYETKENNLVAFQNQFSRTVRNLSSGEKDNLVKMISDFEFPENVTLLEGESFTNAVINQEESEGVNLLESVITLIFERKNTPLPSFN